MYYQTLVINCDGKIMTDCSFFVTCGFTEETDRTQANMMLDSTNYFEIVDMINIK